MEPAWLRNWPSTVGDNENCSSRIALYRDGICYPEKWKRHHHWTPSKTDWMNWSWNDSSRFSSDLKNRTIIFKKLGSWIKSETEKLNIETGKRNIETGKPIWNGLMNVDVATFGARTTGAILNLNPYSSSLLLWLCLSSSWFMGPTVRRFFRSRRIQIAYYLVVWTVFLQECP